MYEPSFIARQGGGEGLMPSVSASGDIDSACVEELDTILRSVAVDADEVYLDLRGVTYCDSSVLRVLFSVAVDTDLTLTVTSTGPMRSLLRISGLDRLTTVNIVD